MRMLTCEECRKRYDFDKDDFCPRCGAFNQPEKKWGIDAKGNVIRVDGVNEQTHANSFVHREVHREKDIRRATGLDWDRPAAKRPTAAPARTKAGTGNSISGAAKRYEAKKKRSGSWIGVILVLLFLLLRLLFSLIH